MSRQPLLSIEQRSRLNDVMVSLFPTYKDFVQFMKNRLDFNVGAEVDGETVKDAVFGTLQIFEPENKAETDLRRLLNALVTEFDANRALKSLQLELTGSQEQDADYESETVLRGLADSQRQNSRGRIAPGAGSQATSQSRRAGAKSFGQTKDRQGDKPAVRPIERKKLVEMLSALNTLERLREELDRALKAFVDSQAGNVVLDVDIPDDADTALEFAANIAQDIQLAADVGEARDLLSQLLLVVQTGIEIAERDGKFDDVREFAKDAGESCKKVGQMSDGAESLVLLNIVAFWRMREAYAEHQPKIPSTTK